MTNSKNYKFLGIILSAAIFFNVAIGFVLARKLYWTYPHVVKSNKIEYFLNRQQYFEVFPADSNSIIFLGNSLTQNFDVTELLQDLRIKNRGIYGDHTAGVLNRITPILQSKPRKVFIEIGLNDLLHQVPRDTVLRNYEQIIDTLQNGGGTEVYIQSLLPIANTGEAADLPHINDDIRYLNEKLKSYALEHKASYVDLYARFSLNGSINPLYFSSDGEHLTGQGYLLWAELVKPLVNQK
ncbi:MAG: GDSL-type esterase/lipase family protein [Chitinophagaceae bacterium]|nr:GDSL-type esterase/lipase family protein [Chitinophagaceae bacterium]